MVCTVASILILAVIYIRKRLYIPAYRTVNGCHISLYYYPGLSLTKKKIIDILYKKKSNRHFESLASVSPTREKKPKEKR